MKVSHTKFHGNPSQWEPRWYKHDEGTRRRSRPCKRA